MHGKVSVTEDRDLIFHEIFSTLTALKVIDRY